MNRTLPLIILTLCSLTLSAQSQVYELHPAVGDTIDKVEIRKYFLFSDYLGDSIDYVIIRQNKDLFTLEGISGGTETINIQISEDEILLQKEQVEKLSSYFNAVLEKDSANFEAFPHKASVADSVNISNFDLNITPEFIKSVKKDMRRKYWEEKRKEIDSNRKKGMIF
ncbi:hypothetical protein INQ51_18790 [Maribellus sp. CM-23]|uniref:hypothetical protein n=1 Tax=Maribellus sp. CM-23 TaxID=2781026 RepID=UPI001F28EE85|nr:hypothetical protein [Maribellus sp. CM-23]MCE4566374.1 hypothetical protein [Maribellus sp. CM-23]